MINAKALEAVHTHTHTSRLLEKRNKINRIRIDKKIVMKPKKQVLLLSFLRLKKLLNFKFIKIKKEKNNKKERSKRNEKKKQKNKERRI